MQNFISTLGVDGFDHIADPDIEVWRMFGIRSQPSFAFLNDDGTVETHPGAYGLEGLTERVEQLVAA